MINAPCHHCKYRQPDCHAKCEKYKAFRDELNKINKVKQSKISETGFEISIKQKLRKKALKNRPKSWNSSGR